MGKCIDCKIQKECRQSEFLIGCKVFKPKEKPMENKVIFESEKEFDKFYDNNLTIFKHEKAVVRQILKSQGYIRKSAVEGAEFLLETIEHITDHGDAYQLGTHDYCILSKGFQELKSEIEVLKNGNKNKE